ncbi:Alanine--tRNA ligase [Jeotgalicoccus aerolatus]|uniref:Alanine--tRNA ligase n=1 Tax=Jeotgalicoccus aerolatus TaxID=709510 RepID=A0A1G8UHB3_9STAP|nr:alanine--tRNA ligase [Jeotgalicoccus aerolatus]MBP1951648.1 alanyl-tRNA synthetase [Jeotgalicoccus aerolatus]GGD95886.1 alanine--tRNA ligase [Jeotgalicoccus aerolatus]CAD2075781.1 Alanine--tRNA ligase [Jeotgalicoccus aerolatus]SDJ53223.1 alanyl-tRNA synthetase [Jeotgalicoccus aerolatus]
MKKLTGNEIRQMFLDYFKAHDHMVEPSAPLVPIDDDSLLWINSGVATLKKYFDGRVVPENPRIVNAQKAIRTNDIENVGFTARHHTFFEMLGNFSIGNYFKEEAIIRAWEFLTDDQWIGFDKDLLYVTVHPEDNDALNIWKDVIGLDESRIIRIEGNFWDIGEGPCGPNSEIFYDRGEAYDTVTPAEEMYPGGENERYLEIWNLVFSEFNHNKDGSYTPLPKQNIDTGMGLERITSVIQDAKTNFDTDLFTPIIREIETVSGQKYGVSDALDTAFKVISDHIRTVSFAIADGALPSNEGRGYVLRRLIRRAVRFSKDLNIKEAFMYRLVDVVAEVMGGFYPNVKEKTSFIKDVVKGEEERFLTTLDDGIKIYQGLRDQAAAGDKIISGKDAFKLYDTYGFPYELTVEYAALDGLTVDESAFNEEMTAQKQRARDARKSGDSMQVQSETFHSITEPSVFTGYENTEGDSELRFIVSDDEIVQEYSGENPAEVIFKETPFYAESGGQIADTGIISNAHGTAEVDYVYKAPNGQNVHVIRVIEGVIQSGESYTLKVNSEKRRFVMKNHTATHLMHQALKDVIGEHANQAGSLVQAERLRFDFSHLESLTNDELTEIENIVNEKIYAGLNVTIEEMPIDQAKEKGAMALFGEKYGDIVRVVDIDQYSVELCGGIHVRNTSDIGLFKIVSENGIGAGIRRIEAVTSKYAADLYKESELALENIAGKVKAKISNVEHKVDQLLEDKKALQHDYDKLKKELQQSQLNDLSDATTEVNGVQVIRKEVEAEDGKDLRAQMDLIKSQNQDSIVALAAVTGDKVSLVVTVPKALTDKVRAGDIMKGMANIVGGKGGGRPDMAQGGGTNIESITAALQFVDEYIKDFL